MESTTIENIIISVVIPVYNVEAYIEECIKSLMNQTFKQIEMIFIDDGSTDNSGKICDFYAEEDERIKVLHTTNQGLSAARNKGIECANGKYIAFVDSDDYVSSEWLARLYDAITKKQADIAECNFIYKYGSKEINSRKMKESVVDSKEAMHGLLVPPYLGYVNAWNKLYKSELFQEIRFPEGKIHEDEYTTYKLLYTAKAVVYIDEYLYFYRQREKSIINSSFSEKKMDALEAAKGMQEFFVENDIDMMQESVFHRYTIDLNLLNAMIDSNYDDELWQKVFYDIVSCKKQIKNNPYLKLGHRISLYFILMGEKPYKLFYKISAGIRKIK